MFPQVLNLWEAAYPPKPEGIKSFPADMLEFLNNACILTTKTLGYALVICI